MKRGIRFGLCTLFILVANGCGTSGAKTCEVSGTVTWNGQPIPRGDIIFYPEDGLETPEAAKIIGGKFHLRAKPGWKLVQIHASREVPGSLDPVMQSPVREAYIPAEYNKNTILREEIKAEGKNHFTFDLPVKR
jgi:hypothetical protein